MEMVKCRVTTASGVVIGSDGSIARFNGPRMSPGVAQTVTHSQVASNGTRVINVHNAAYGHIYLHIYIVIILL
jgi:hypothetical protein